MIDELLAKLRQTAEELQRFGGDEQAAATHETCDRVTIALVDWWAEPLTIAQASEWGGFSESQLRKLVNEGVIRFRPDGKIRRMHVPVRPGHELPLEKGLQTPTGPRRPTQVYAIQNTATLAIKIGISFAPKVRMAALQSTTTDRLVLLGAMPGSFTEETALHQRFAEFRLSGEWFRPAREILAWAMDLIGVGV